MKKFLLLIAFTALLYNKKAVAQTCPILTAPPVGNSWFEHTIDFLEINNVYSPYSGLNNNGTYLSITTTPFWTLYAGKSNPLYAGVGQAQNPEIFACWIDYNQNGFYDANESVFGQNAGLAEADIFFNISMNIPADVQTGTYHIRFRVSYTDVQTSACNYTGNGETEDYVINIIQPGTALNFDGIDDYCQKPTIANMTNKLTLETRLTLTDTLWTGQMILYNGDVNTDGIGLYIPPHDSAVSVYYGGKGLFNTGYKLTRGVCTSISAVINDSLLFCYVNGVNTYSVNTGAVPNSPSGNLTIGANTSGTNNFYGSIDDIRMWSRPLCASEISAHIQCQLTGKEPGLSAYYRFNEGVAADSNLTVTVLADSSVNGLNSTLYNFGLLDSVSNWVYAPGAISTTACGYYAGSFTLSTVGNGVCPGDSATLSVSGASTYTWSTGATASSIVVKPTVNTSYSVSAIDLNGCGSMERETIYIGATNITVSSINTSICFGGTTTLTANQVATCTWTPAIATTNTATVVSPTVTTTYSVTGISNAGGCHTDTASITVIVNALPQTNAYALLPAICKNSTDTLIVSGAKYYGISPNTNAVYLTTIPARIVVSPSVTTTYTITGEDSNYCINAYVMSVTVSPNPVSNVTIAQTACGLCNGTATAMASGGTAPYEYLWNGSIYNAVANNLCAGTYTCIVTDTNSCKDTVHAVINSSNTSGLNASYTLTADATPHVWNVYPSVSGGAMPYTYLWVWGDGTTDTALYTSHTYTAAGNYNVCLVVIDANGCSYQYCVSDSLYRTSNTNNTNSIIYINVTNNATGINEVLDNEQQLLVYPNPANTVVNIKSKGYNAVCRVYDVLENIVIDSEELAMQHGYLKIDISNFAKGVYFIRVNNSIQKFIKE